MNFGHRFVNITVINYLHFPLGLAQKVILNVLNMAIITYVLVLKRIYVHLFGPYSKPLLVIVAIFDTYQKR